MFEREYKLPCESVVNAINTFKKNCPEAAELCLKTFEDITQKYPESGLTVPDRPFARRIVDRFEFCNMKFECDLTYTFNDQAVLWLLFKVKPI